MKVVLARRLTVALAVVVVLVCVGSRHAVAEDSLDEALQDTNFNFRFDGIDAGVAYSYALGKESVFTAEGHVLGLSVGTRRVQVGSELIGFRIPFWSSVERDESEDTRFWIEAAPLIASYTFTERLQPAPWRYSFAYLRVNLWAAWYAPQKMYRVEAGVGADMRFPRCRGKPIFRGGARLGLALERYPRTEDDGRIYDPSTSVLVVVTLPLVGLLSADLNHIADAKRLRGSKECPDAVIRSTTYEFGGG